MSEKRYLVTENQLFKTIRFALELRINDRHFVENLMGDIEQILDFNCFEEYKESEEECQIKKQ